MKLIIKSTVPYLALLVICIASPAWAQRSSWWGTSNMHDSRDVRSGFKPIVADAGQSTVRVLCDGKETELGTVVDADGWIITKYSELREPVVCRLPDKRQLPAEIVGQDMHYDLALLKVDAHDLKPVQWSEDDKGPIVGQMLATVAGTGDLPRAIGVVSVPRRAILPDARLGVGFDESQSLAKINRVINGSAAAQAGLKVGDIVVSVDETPVDSHSAMIDIVHQLRPGDKIAMVVHRGDDTLNLTATLTSPYDFGPLNRSERMNAMGTQISKRSADFPPIIQHDTAILPADCGGPLVDLDGKVVGINIARGGRTESYAVPADKIRAELFDMEHGKMAPKNPLPGLIVKKDEVKTDKVTEPANKTTEGPTKAAVP